MKDIHFTVMGDVAAHLEPLLEQFKAETGLHVRLEPLAWDIGWGQLLNFALYGQGPDISEIGSTWVGDFINMQALHPFTEREAAQLGSPSAYLHPGGESALISADSLKWAVPWLTGARLLYYRRNLLEKAGVEVETAFTSPQAVTQTLDRLQSAGVSVPWTVPTNHTHTNVLNIASWVWAAGGDFVTPDGKKTLFFQPAARQGMRQYFELVRFIPEQARRLGGLEPDDLFINNTQTAATLSGAWLYEAAETTLPPDELAQVGFTSPPGASFRGGSYLVVWKHSPNESEAVRLVHFLSRPEKQAVYAPKLGLTPARREAFALEPFASHPLWQSAVAALETSRSFPVIRSWGLLEDRLSGSLYSIWQELLAEPAQPVDRLLEKYLSPLARMMDITLGQVH